MQSVLAGLGQGMLAELSEQLFSVGSEWNRLRQSRNETNADELFVVLGNLPESFYLLGCPVIKKFRKIIAAARVALKRGKTDKNR